MGVCTSGRVPTPLWRPARQGTSLPGCAADCWLRAYPCGTAPAWRSACTAWPPNESSRIASGERCWRVTCRGRYLGFWETSSVGLDNVDPPLAEIFVGAPLCVIAAETEAHVALLDGVFCGPALGEYLEHGRLRVAHQAGDFDACPGMVAKPGLGLGAVHNAAA